MTRLLLPVKAIIGFSSMSLLLAQVAPIGSTVPGIDALGRLSLDGCLMAAVIALWRALARKDEQVVKMAEKMTETMAVATAALTEMRAVVNQVKAENERIVARIERGGFGELAKA